jgi:hypothetical protein
MKSFCAKLSLPLLAVIFIVLSGASPAQEPPAEPPPDNVAGNWKIYAKNVNNGGSSTKYVEIRQNGNQLAGHFKGPHQSGGIEGTINVHHIVFRTKTRNVLTFRGRVDGNRMSGEYGIHGEHGEWEAERVN